jgi:hypothetical protein
VDRAGAGAPMKVQQDDVALRVDGHVEHLPRLRSGINFKNGMDSNGISGPFRTPGARC